MSEKIKTHKFKALQKLGNFRGSIWKKGKIIEFSEPVPAIVWQLEREKMIKKIGEGSKPKHEKLMEDG